MTVARNWLPMRAARAPGVKACIGALTDAWSARWFAADAICLQRISVRRRGRDPLLETGPTTDQGALLSAHFTPDGEAELLGLALDHELQSAAATRMDKLLLDGLRCRIMTDLIGAIEARLQAPTGARVDAETGDVCLEFGWARRAPMFVLGAPTAAFVNLVHDLLEPPPDAQTPLARVSDALSDTRVTLAVHAGCARLTVAELRNLTTGDVLILDRALSEGVALRSRDGDTLLAAGDMHRVDGRTAISLKAKSRGDA